MSAPFVVAIRISGGSDLGCGRAAIVDHEAACIATAGRNDKEFPKFGKWHRIMARLIGQHAVLDFRSHKKASGASSRKCFNETKLRHVLKAGGKVLCQAMSLFTEQDCAISTVSIVVILDRKEIEFRRRILMTSESHHV